MNAANYILFDDEAQFFTYCANTLRKEFPIEYVNHNYAFRRSGESCTEIYKRVIELVDELGAFSLCTARRLGGLGLGDRYGALFCRASGYVALPLSVSTTLAFSECAVAQHILPPHTWSNISYVMEASQTVYPDLTTVVIARREDGYQFLTVDSWSDSSAPVDWGRPLGVISATPVGQVLETGLASRLVARERVFALAYMVGLAERILDLTIDYVNTREQFGRKIGSFQALKHQLADAKTNLESVKPLLWFACCSLDLGNSDAEHAICAASLLVKKACMSIARTYIQCHGGIAYTTEYSLHAFIKRMWSIKVEDDVRNDDLEALYEIIISNKYD